MDLRTVFAGLHLDNPIIVSSSSLTDSTDKILSLEACGAGAVVLKSVFEEQILFEGDKLMESSDYPEAGDYIRHYTRSNRLDEYLNLIGQAKGKAGIPVIASINCQSTREWTGFARKIQDAGADALELNVYFMPVDLSLTSRDYEQTYLDLLADLKSMISIPLIIKLGQHFTHLAGLVEKLYHRGADGVVLFNRFYSPDIDVDRMKMTSAEVFSSPADIRGSLRWVAIISSLVEKIDLAASTGIHDGKAIVKQVLAGAKAVQVCSVLYRKGPEYLKQMRRELEEWMRTRNYDSLDAFRGTMNYGHLENPAVYERSQFMKYFSAVH